jgi:outer membrane immunogenic protein
VTGLELDFSVTDIKGSAGVTGLLGGGTISSTDADDVKYLGTLRARAGAAPFPLSDWNVLFYGTGGLAWERANRIVTQLVVFPASSQFASITTPRDHFGWVAGAGAEVRLGSTNWIARAEYLHYDFGAVETELSSSTTPGVSFSDSAGRQRIDVVRGGLSYKVAGAI